MSAIQNMDHSGPSIPSLENGIRVISDHVRTLPLSPGVYRMLSAQGDVLYVGKARELKKRVASYTQPRRLPLRLQRMVAETRSMEFVVTHTEAEALLLEANFIRKLSPRYNILLKDSKFYPCIALSGGGWPRLMKHRGPRDPGNQYFGPFASTSAVHESLTALYKAFRIRSCTDSFFASRKRPCMQYHIKRCSAPCVGFVTAEEYNINVRDAIECLKGRSDNIQRELAERMVAASEKRDYEHAALYRDQIRALSQLQSRQTINTTVLDNTDIFALFQRDERVCIQVFFFRNGSNYGSLSLFPEHVEGMSPGEILSSVLPVFYGDREPPPEILVSHEPEDKKLIEQAFAERGYGVINVLCPKKGEKTRFVKHALGNAQEALERLLAHTGSLSAAMRDLALLLGLSKNPNRIEVYDNSHTQGTNAIGAMIVVGPEGFRKKEYRKFNIRNPEVAGDDYGMMREVITRRFSGSLAAQAGGNEVHFPDLLVIDGGQGQINCVSEVLSSLGIDIPVLGIAKGLQRNAGRETFWQPGKPPFMLEQQPNVLYFLQRIRDEAHRFAIGTHRARREKGMTGSTIADIPGIGPTRKKALLLHFGSLKGIQNARVEDLERVEGISASLARKVYGFFHGN